MTMAITKAVEEGAKVVVCASTGNTSASAAAYAARAGITCGVVIPEGKIALGKLAQALIHGAQVVQIRGNFDQALDVVRALGDVDGVSRRQLDQPVPHRGAEDRVVRDRRGARRRARRALPPGRQRRQHHRVLEGLRRVRDARSRDPPAADARLAGPGRRAARARRAGAAPRDDRHRDPHRQPRELGRRDRGPRRVGRRDRHGERRRDPRRVPAARRDRGRVRRAGVGGVGRRAAAGAARSAWSSGASRWCAR